MNEQKFPFEPKRFEEKGCADGEFPVAAVGLEHGHIYLLCDKLKAAGATIAAVWDEDEEKVRSFQKYFPEARKSHSLEEILEDEKIKMVVSAAIPSERMELGLKVLDHDKDYFTDKPGFVSLEQLELARKKVAEMGKIWEICYSDRVANESAIFAGQIIEQGGIGKVIQVIGLGPHRLDAQSRPDWFFRKNQSGGILTDLASHLIEQFLYFTESKDAKVVHAFTGNFSHPQFPELEDFGEANLVADSGARFYCRVDWFTPNGLRTWGDGRTFILGADGYIELRKYIDVAKSSAEDHLFLVNQDGEFYYNATGKVGFPYFADLIRRSLHKIEDVDHQDHIFKTAELSLKAQELADGEI